MSFSLRKSLVAAYHKSGLLQSLDRGKDNASPPSSFDIITSAQVYTRPLYAKTLETLAEAGDRGEHYLGFYRGQVRKGTDTI